MHDYDSATMGGAGRGSFAGEEGRPGREHSVASLVAMVAVLAIGAGIALAVGFWLLGALIGLAGLALKVAVLTAVAALVWRKVSRHPARGGL